MGFPADYSSSFLKHQHILIPLMLLHDYECMYSFHICHRAAGPLSSWVKVSVPRRLLWLWFTLTAASWKQLASSPLPPSHQVHPCVCVCCVCGVYRCLVIWNVWSVHFFYVLLCFSQVHRLHPLLWLHPRTKTPAPSTTGIPQFTTMSCQYAAGIPADFCTKTDWDQVIITPMHAISHGQADLVIQVTVEM